MTTTADITRYDARITIASGCFGTFTQNTPLSLRDCLDNPKRAARLAAKAMAKCAMGKVVSVELVLSDNS